MTHPTDTVLTASPRCGAWLFPLLLAVACTLAYANSFSGAYHMDDRVRIVDAPEIRDWRTAVRQTSRPLVGLSLWANYRAGANRADFHLFNLLVHLGATLALFGSLRYIVPEVGGKEKPVPVTGLAFGTALLWGLHPLQTESVTYIIQRAEAMMGMFFLLGSYGFLRGLATGHRRWFVLTTGALAGAVASKPLIVIGPLLLLLYDRQFVAGSLRGAWRARGGWYLAFGLALLLGMALMLRPNESSSTVGLAAGLIEPWRYALTQPAVIARYLRLSILPVGQCFDYAWPPAMVRVSTVLQLFSAGMAVVGCGILAWRRRPLGYAAVTFLLMLAPTSSVIPVADSAVEHRLYLPLAVVLTTLVIGCWRLAARSGMPVGRRNRLLIALLLSVVGALGVATHRRNALYASSVAMARDIVAKRPDNFRARIMLANALLQAGECQAALEATTVAADHARRRAAQGGVYALTGAMNAGGYLPVVLNTQGRARLGLGQFEQARDCFGEAVMLLPTMKEAWLNLAIASRELDDLADALQAGERALALDPDYARALAVRGSVLTRMGGYAAACEAFEAAAARGFDIDADPVLQAEFARARREAAEDCPEPRGRRSPHGGGDE
jgi:protein O-mannosyl-transferase